MASDGSNQALWGRARECDALDDVLAAARSGQSSVLVLRGEAGIGKSALLDHLAEKATMCRVERVAGVESEMELAFAGLHQLCGSMVDDFDHLPGPQRGALTTIFGFEAGPPPDRFLLGLAVLGLLSAVAEQRGLVCIVDDAQWIDRASLQVLAFVARRLSADSVGMVFAVRLPTDVADLDDLPDLSLGGLTDSDARALLEAIAPGSLDEVVRERIVAESGGNPLALTELVRGMTPAEVEFGFAWPAALPVADRIEQEYLRQLQGLPADTQHLLLLASVEPVGDLALLWRAAALLGIPADAAGPAEAAGLILIGPPMRFRHPLVRSALRRGTDMPTLRQVHHALAEATDGNTDPDRRAWHRAHAADAPDETVAAELERAADRAQQRGGMAAAAAFLQRASELTPDPAARGTRLIAAARAKAFAVENDAALALVSEAERCPLDQVQRIALVSLRAFIYSAVGRQRETAQMQLEIARELEPTDPVAARGKYLGAFGSAMYCGRLDGPAVGAIAVAARDGPPKPEPPRLTDLLIDGLATLVTAGHRDAVGPLRLALEGCERDPRGRGEPHRPHVAGEHVEWLWFAPPIAVELWDRAAWNRLTARLVELGRTSGALSTRLIALDGRARCLVHSGDLAAAASVVDEADSISDATGGPRVRTASLELAAWRGREAPAVEAIDASVEYWASAGYGRQIGVGAYATAVLYNGLARYDDALAAAQRACEYEDLGLFGMALVELVEAAERTGERSVAAEAFERLEEGTQAAGTDWALGMLARSGALLADPDAAEPHYVEAIDRLERSGLAPHSARARLLYGEWLRRESRRVEAREQLRSAYESLTNMGIEAFAERVRRELEATGEKARKRTIETRLVLTPREAQVARLAAERRTNPEIGAQLFISPRTVEYHLAKVFTKLDISSRRDLPTALREIGFVSATTAT